MKLGQFETISKTGTYYLLARDGEGMGEGNTFTYNLSQGTDIMHIT